MGGAFMVALLAIYVLVVGQFGSFKLPLVILTPVPLTLIGIVLGHMLFGAPFTATSMIGFIALAGSSCAIRSCWSISSATPPRRASLCVRC
jgi:multidrug efflux pump subunit AcrB